MRAVVYTIGHSSHAIGWFIELLLSQGVNCVVDVRSIAASRFNPQYNKKKLDEALKEKGIAYLHMPEEFGARQTSPDILTGGKVDFEKVRRSDAFNKGVERIREGVKKGYSIALMCAEAEPLDCHRFSMISVALKDEFEVLHILKDKTIITNADLEEKLLRKFQKKLSPSLFEDRLIAAYNLQNLSIAFSPGQS
ncbi:MAG TPA: DUF488 domain-containing protein [Cyclobacteriaceae bacterium]|nr:DUF488 domain-containing protein [Cyclobacteriaceae bacterium]